MILRHVGSIKQWLWAPIKHPPGPSWLQIRDEAFKAQQNMCFDYPVKLAGQFGDMVYISLFKQYLITGPEYFEYLLKTNHENYQRNPFIYLKRMKPAFGKSLLVTEGSYWKHRRKIALPAYQQVAIKNYVPIITNQVQMLLTKWQTDLPSKINILTEMTLLTLKIALKIFCSREFPDPVLRSFGHSIQYCNWYCSNAFFLNRFIPTINNLRFLWHTHKIDQFLLTIIQERKKNPTVTEDLLNLLIQAKNEETNHPFTDTEILAEFKTHVVTGHETTACGLSWMWYLLALHPNYRTRMENELDSVLHGRLPTLSDIPNLPLTKAIISETFRLYPPIWSLARTNIEEDTLGGYKIPAGSQLILHIYALHRNPHYWEKPNEFYPERFLETDKHKRHPFLYLPFSAGLHTCIASHLATVEITLITAMLLKKVKLGLTRRSKGIPEACISLRPKGGIQMRPTLQ